METSSKMFTASSDEHIELNLATDDQILSNDDYASCKKQCRMGDNAFGENYIHIKIVYLLAGLNFGSLLPVMSLFLNSSGIPAHKIGILVALKSILSFIVSPITGFIGDYYHHLKIMMCGFFFLSTLFRSSMYFFSSNHNLIPLIVAIYLIAEIFGMAHYTLFVSATLKMLNKNDEGTSYGRQRLFSSVGYGVCAVLIALITNTGGYFYNFLFHFILGIMCLITTILWIEVPSDKIDDVQLEDITPEELHSSTMEDGEIDLNLESSQTLNSDTAEDSKNNTKSNHTSFVNFLTSADLIHVVLNRSTIVFLVMMFSYGMMISALQTFFALYLSEIQANNSSQIVLGLSVLFACISEIGIYFCSPSMLLYIGEENMVTLSFIFGIVRLLWYYFFKNPYIVILGEFLQGPTYGVLSVASVNYMNKLLPKGMESVGQGLLRGAFSGLGAGFGSLIGGFVIKYFSTGTLFLSSAALLAACLILFLVVQKFFTVMVPASI